MRHIPALTGILAILGCDYTPPDADFGTPLNVIAGTVDVAGVELPANTVILVTDAANPGPPVGTGSPATFATVPAAAFSEPTAAGLSGAPWAVTNVPDGNWVVTALMDQDNDFFFSSAISALAGATCGDALGAHVDSTGALAPIPAEGGSLVDEITIEISTVLSSERPAFTLEAEDVDGSPANGPSVSLATAIDPSTVFPQQFRLSATAVKADVLGLGEYEYRLDGPFDPTSPLPCQTGFLARLVDADLDGVPDELPGFPGLVAVAAAGHTPGSTVYAAAVGDRILVFAGDITNEFANLVNDVPKPWAYSAFVVPENRAHLGDLRRWLGGLEADPRFTVVVAHDLERMVAAGLTDFAPTR